MKSISSTLLLLAVCTTVTAQHIDCVYHFENDIDTLSPDQFKDAEIWAASHYHFRHDVLEIRGHTDQHADDAYNEALSLRRARHLESIFKRIGFDQIRLSYYGEKVPLCEDDHEDCRSKNRRVEVILYNEPEQKWMATAELDPPQVIFANTQEKIVVEGSGGTKVLFGLGSLLAPNGFPYFGPIRVELREVLNPLDCIRGNISTICDDQLIETGGMAELQVYRLYDNALLTVNNDVEIQFPSQQLLLQKGMRTFEAEQKLDAMIWTPTDWKVDPYDLRWRQVVRKQKRSASEYYPTGTGAPGTTDEIVPDIAYKCDTIWLTKEQLQQKRARASQGTRLSNSIRVQQMGWINCDRFMNERSAIALKINTDCSETTTFVLFNDRRVAFNYTLYGGIAIPPKESITIVCLSGVNEQGLTAFAMKKVVHTGEIVDVKVEWLTKEELAKREKALESVWS